MSKIRAWKISTTIALISISIATHYYYSRIVIVEKLKIPPTTSQFEKFLNDSGLKNISIDSVVYFRHGPNDSWLLAFAQGRSEYYQVVLKLNRDEVASFTSDKAFSLARERKLKPPTFAGFDAIDQPSDKSYLYLSGRSPTSKYSNLNSVIDNRGDFSYGYIELALPEDPIQPVEPKGPS